jgi:hypothetical protein
MRAWLAALLLRIADRLHQSDADERWRAMWAKEFHRKESL